MNGAVAPRKFPAASPSQDSGQWVRQQESRNGLLRRHLFDAVQLLRTRGKMINFRRFSRLLAASFVVVASFGGASMAQAQSVIAGRVTDDAGNGIPAVNVVIPNPSGSVSARALTQLVTTRSTSATMRLPGRLSSSRYAASATGRSRATSRLPPERRPRTSRSTSRSASSTRSSSVASPRRRHSAT